MIDTVSAQTQAEAQTVFWISYRRDGKSRSTEREICWDVDRQGSGTGFRVVWSEEQQRQTDLPGYQLQVLQVYPES